MVPMPVLFTTRAELHLAGALAVEEALASTPFNKKVLLVSRCPLAHTGALPKPALAPVPEESSAFTPGERIARPVKEPVGSGTDFNLAVCPSRSRWSCPPC